MKIQVPSMLAIGLEKHTKKTNKQAQWLITLVSYNQTLTFQHSLFVHFIQETS